MRDQAVDDLPEIEEIAGDAGYRGRSETSSRKSRRWRVGLVALLTVVLFVWIVRYPLLTASAAFLDVAEEPVAADLIFLLGGGVFSRAPTAAELYRAEFAPRILLARIQDDDATRLGIFPNETDATRDLLVAFGVPDSAIVTVRRGNGVRSTTDEAILLRGYLERDPAERVLVVTNNFHTRRARWNIRRQLKGLETEIRMVGAPDPRFSESDWWQAEEGMLAYLEEYLKFVHNWMLR